VAFEARSVFFLKKYLSLFVGLAIIALIVIIWLETSKITGDVAVAGSNSAAVTLSGARVTLYKVTEEQQQRLSAAYANLQQQNQQEKDANARVFSAESTDNSIRSTLAGYNNLADTKHCFALEKVVDEIRQSAIRKETTDSQGHFGFRALPGHYFLEIVSQQNGQYVVFVEQVEPKWHTYFKLTQPSCRYSLTD
jgi:preprotein translocase subunit SecF